MIYRYRFSDAEYHNFVAEPFVHWEAIPEAKGIAVTDFDRGGLVVQPNPLQKKTATASSGWILGLARHAFAHLADCLLMTSEKMLHRHSW